MLPRWYDGVGRSDCEGNTGTTENTKWTKPGKLKRLANCQRGNNAVTFYYWLCKECSAITANPTQNIPKLETEKHTICDFSFLIFFFTLPNNIVILSPRTYGTLCIIRATMFLLDRKDTWEFFDALLERRWKGACSVLRCTALKFRLVVSVITSHIVHPWFSPIVLPCPIPHNLLWEKRLRKLNTEAF
jgi:hypothetical protein